MVETLKDETLNPLVITAIGDYDFESFVAGTLFSQGWNVIYRALDKENLRSFLATTSEKNLVVMYSPDLPGLTPDDISAICMEFPRIIGIQSLVSNQEFPDLHPRPIHALELINLVRGNLRAPMIRVIAQEKLVGKKAYVHSFVSIGPGTGCTTLAINYAAELSELGKKVLLIDANASAPAVAIYLEIRNLKSDQEFKKVSEFLSAIEVSQRNYQELILGLEKSSLEFDYLIIDLGSVTDLQNTLTDRRWVSQAAIWASSHADEITFVSTPEVLSATRLRNFVSSLPKISLRSKLSFTLNQRNPGKRGNSDEEAFLACVTPLKPESLQLLPLDVKSLQVAKREHKALLEINERSVLRKAIYSMASQRIS
jgi:Mrp family chromosome partitioning ATPase